ncbi:uncharacterized protein [Hemitrygon akajei]|uniref:uncharacterized protein n=1 Tax=Hemitrygon akajei TaxID=2704970 RepID=UPI003BF9E614
MKEVLLTKGCPGDEKKCVIRVEGCRGPVKCGWGKPVYISDDEVELQCIFTNPSKKYDFVWKLIATDQEPTILMDNEPTIRVEKEDQPEAYQCDTLLADEVVASIKYSVYTNTEGSKETRNSSLGVKSQIVLMAVAGGALMVVISIICGILFFCFKRSKQREIKKRPPPRPPLPSQYNSRKQPKRLSKPGAKIPKAQQPHSTQQRTRSLARPPLSSPKQPRWSRRSLTRPREPPPPTPSKVPPLSSSPRPRGSPSSRLDKQGPRPVPDNETSYAEEPTASYADYATAFDSTELMKHI